MHKYDIMEKLDDYLESIWSTLDTFQGNVYLTEEIPLTERDEISSKIFTIKERAGIVRDELNEKYFILTD